MIAPPARAIGCGLLLLALGCRAVLGVHEAKLRAADAGDRDCTSSTCIHGAIGGGPVDAALRASLDAGSPLGSSGKDGAGEGGALAPGAGTSGGTEGAAGAGSGGEGAGGNGGGSGGEGGAADAGDDAGSGTGGTSADPCIGIACNTRPAATCFDPTTLRSFASVGSCVAGKCTYQSSDEACQFGCKSDMCNPDPCAGVSCATPPANGCEDSGHLTTHDTTGSCSGGTCSYASHSIACTCSNDTCTTDPCALIVCNTPPSPSCFDAQTRQTFAQSGTCSGGSCSYSPTDEACVNTTCTGGACVGVCAPGQAHCANNSTESCSSTGTWTNTTACVNQACVNSQCVGMCTPNPTPMQCADIHTPELCNSSGAYQAAIACTGAKPVCLDGMCVGCTQPSQCSVPTECYSPTCNGNACGQTVNGEGSPCTGGVGWICNGAGTCAVCTSAHHANCSSSEVCRNFACMNAVHTQGWETSIASTSNPAINWLYMMKMPALAHDAALLAFGVVGTTTAATYKLALYADNGSGTQPGTGAPLAATVTGIAVTNGAVETTSFIPTTVSLTAGTTYWLAFKTNAQVNIRAAANAAQLGFRGSNAFTNAFPSDPMATLSPVLSETGTEYAAYVRVQDTD